MTDILITNDDGYQSEGIDALFEVFQKLGNVQMIAPESDRSAVSHSLTINKPLRVTTVAPDRQYIDGTPADCVAIGVEKILQKKPDLLVSGINRGPNIGDDISYSGTVSAAIEGTMYSIPSIAVSLSEKEGDFLSAARIALNIATLALRNGLPENTLLNVNIPAAAHQSKGIRITRQGRKFWQNGIQVSVDPWGEPLYWVGGGIPRTDRADDTDVCAINEGYVSVTPIHLDKTNHEGIFHIREDWDLSSILE